MLPPLMFFSEELDALVLGMRWVADRGDRTLSSGALSALAKIAAVLPTQSRLIFCVPQSVKSGSSK
jgi:predicted DNA-binding transcriptional regulator YafY